MPPKHTEHKLINGNMTKMCSCCKKDILLEDFHNSSKTWDNLSQRCKKCQSLKYQKRQEKVIEERKKIQKITRDKILNWLQNNKEHIIKYVLNIFCKHFLKEIHERFLLPGRGGGVMDWASEVPAEPNMHIQVSTTTSACRKVDLFRTRSIYICI